jgi:geranylgeranyl diphosphate synthase type II
MNAILRIERALENAVSVAAQSGCPPRLEGAVRHAVFPGGARIRPLLCLAVAAACKDRNPALTDAAAAAIELLHCASLVHDDLPCFDDADTRRGRPSVHSAFGEPTAVLVGDALIVLSFETLANALQKAPAKLPGLLAILTRSVGISGGLIAGQAWESELSVPLKTYQAAKTGSLFVAATKAGAACAGWEAAEWEQFGARLGEAFQVADDLRDVFATEAEIGKPVGQDAALGRPNAIAQLGRSGAIRHFEGLVASALKAIPRCPGADDLSDLVRAQVTKFVPRGVAVQLHAA